MADAQAPKPTSSVKLVLLGEAAVGKVGFEISVLSSSPTGWLCTVSPLGLQDRIIHIYIP